ncbi:hypothetical protein MHC_03080 [Mycoplasma haemocanis str. Illinois]|uniref:Uncharacterized protein n=1 Tax=Mycoplasma haemocanis (strain Illinois) TaxID=1111676 RepID=H6N754_MYCHN|nr:hypothetical protein MHC_03080 [Mycoplasma haemocanis str. Illinois]
MSTKAILISLSSMGVVGSIAGGTYLLNMRKEGESLMSLVSKMENRIILDYEKHSKVWDVLVTEYSESNITTIKAKSGKPTKEEIIKFCKDHGSSTDKSLLDSYKLWCSRSNLQGKINSSNTKKWLTSSQSKDWEANKNTYNNNNSENLLINKNDGSTAIQKNSIKEQDLMEWCGRVSSMAFINEQDDDYKRADKFCTVSK